MYGWPIKGEGEMADPTEMLSPQDPWENTHAIVGQCNHASQSTQSVTDLSPWTLET